MPHIVFATCNGFPDFQDSDRLLAQSLEAKGALVSPAPWNGDQRPFEEADAVIIRSTWDYQETPEDFAKWITQIQSGRARIINPPALMTWNMSKRYLPALAEAGVAMAPLRLVEPTAASIASAMDDLGLERAVVKPEFGATASGLSIADRNDPASLASAAQTMAMPGLVQALVSEITTRGETSLIFVAGAFSHAVVKRPKAGDIRCQEEHGGLTERVTPQAWAVTAAREILDLLPEAPFYARIDAVLLDETMQLMEVELIEPELFFTYCPEAAARFAAALIECL